MQSGLGPLVHDFQCSSSYCKMASLLFWASGKRKGVTWLRHLVRAQMHFVQPARDCKGLHYESLGWVIKPTVWHRPCHSHSPFSVICSTPVCMSLRPWTIGPVQSLLILNVWSLVFSLHIFRQQARFLMGKENPLDQLCPFLAEVPPIISEQSEKLQSLVISTQAKVWLKTASAYSI